MSGIGSFRQLPGQDLGSKGSISGGPSVSGPVRGSVWSLGTGSTIADLGTELAVYRLASTVPLNLLYMVYRWSALMRYSCTGTPTITFRMRTGDTTDVDLAASVTVTCRNNASGEPIILNMASVLDGSLWSSSASSAMVGSGGVGGTPFAGTQVNAAWTTANMKRWSLTAQWSVADPLNSVTGKGATLELLNANGIQ